DTLAKSKRGDEETEEAVGCILDIGYTTPRLCPIASTSAAGRV
ncbi:unnamed protein product, partial [Ectocarpus sp. 12 AP-2014]